MIYPSMLELEAQITLSKTLAQQRQENMVGQHCQIGFSGFEPTLTASASQSISQLFQPKFDGTRPSISQPQVNTAQQMNNGSVINAEHKPKFMILPTDPLYDMIVPLYLKMNNLLNNFHREDNKLITSVQIDIKEEEEARYLKLAEEIDVENTKITSLLYNGLMHLKSKLSEIDMSKIQEASKFLYRSKQGLALLESITQKLEMLEMSVAQAEQDLREHGIFNEKVLEDYNAINANHELKLEKSINQVILQKDESTIKEEPMKEDQHSIPIFESSSVERKNHPHQAETNAKPVESTAEKQEKQSEEVEKTTQQFDQEPKNSDDSLPYCTHLTAIQITNLAYGRAVPHPSKLNSHYKSFSSETYGETNLHQMSSILNELNLGPNDVFVDLGSGVGQLIVFVAAAAKIKKVVGIELSALPAQHATEMSTHFKSMMSNFGKTYSPFEIHHGDFMDPKFRDLITKEATVIFVNNLAFTPDLTLKIKNEIIGDLEEGVRIISTKEFGDLKQQINDRTCRDASAILVMRPLKSIDNGVSWTANAVNFWLHTVDRRKVTEYYFSKNEKNKIKSSLSSRKRSLESQTSVSSLKSETVSSPKLNEIDSDYLPSVKKLKKLTERRKKMNKLPKVPMSGKKTNVEFAVSSPSETMVEVQSTQELKRNELKKNVSNLESLWKEYMKSSSKFIPKLKTEFKEIKDDETIFYGRTTRNMWKEQIGTPIETKKSETESSVEWDVTDPAFSSAVKKTRKSTERKKKINKRSGHKKIKTLDAETMSALNQLHEKIVENTQKKHPVDEELARGEFVMNF